MVSICLNDEPRFIRPEILLHPTIPPSLFGVNPRTIKGKEWWDEQRKAAYKANNRCCWACGVPQIDAKYHQWLEAHECYEMNVDKCIATFTEAVALCHSCHAFIHKGRLMQVEPRKKVYDVLCHGADILIEAGLPIPYDVWTILLRLDTLKYETAERKLGIESHPSWSKRWKLLFEGRLYPHE